MQNNPGEITSLLHRVRRGDIAAEEELLGAVYQDLRKLAHHFMLGERKDHTLQATALLHEAWISLLRGAEIDWHDRVHFYALAAKCMRRILVDYARARQAEKRACPPERVELSACLASAESQLDTILLVDRALHQLADWDARQARIVEMRYFGGLTEDEIAAILGVSVRTVKRDWGMAKGWLAHQVGR